MAARVRWNHNLHYHSVILRALPPYCRRLLDVGCGEGLLARRLSGRAGQVVAIDRDAPTIEVARREAAADNLEYVVGDFLTHAFSARFDAIVSVATLHHMGSEIALERMRGLLEVGGTLVVVGLACSRSPADLLFDVAGAAATRWHHLVLRKGYWQSSAPQIWPPAESYSDVRRSAQRAVPGAQFRRHLMWRYSLVWTKPQKPAT